MASPKRRRDLSSSSKQQQQHKHHRPPVLRRVMLHSCLCFLVGLLAGLAPSDWTAAASSAAAGANAHVFRALHAINLTTTTAASLLMATSKLQYSKPPPQQQPQLVVAVTTTGLSERERRSAGLTRTAHALRLVSPPVVWLVVEAAREAPPTARLLRRTGVVYRHLTYNHSHLSSSERHHQLNVAMAHIEEHRLRGVVLFAGLGDVYDLRLLEGLRRIRTFGAWAVATVWEEEQRVAMEGPVCAASSSSAATAWFSTPSFSTVGGSPPSTSISVTPKPPLILDSSPSQDFIHGFAFCSDLLWDPARWDRFPTSQPDQSQDSIKFVQRLLVADYNKTRAIPDDYSNCSRIMAWRVDTILL